MRDNFPRDHETIVRARADSDCVVCEQPRVTVIERPMTLVSNLPRCLSLRVHRAKYFEVDLWMKPMMNDVSKYCLADEQ